MQTIYNMHFVYSLKYLCVNGKFYIVYLVFMWMNGENEGQII